MRHIHDQVRESGHEVHYLCAEDVQAWIRGPLGRFAFPWIVHAKVRAARRARKSFDVVNVHEPSGSVVTMLGGAPSYPLVIVTSHGLDRRAWDLAKEESKLGRQGPRLKSRIIYPLTSLWQSELALRHADHVFCLNFDDRDYLIRHLGIPAGRITRIYPGADALYAVGQAERDYSRAGHILFAGTWRKNKGIEDLVPAFVQLAERRPEISLTVLGAGVPADTVVAVFPRHVRERVRCVQTATEKDTIAVFASSDFFLLPSLFEGTPLTLMEAMMSGLPIVTTATCGMKDVIQHNGNGLLVPIRSPGAIVTAIERLVDDQQLRARLGLAARHDAQTRYTWEAVGRPVREAYERLAGLVTG